MNKKELITAMAGKANLSQKDAGKALEALTAAITETLMADGNLTIPCLGKFQVKERAARIGKNPRTGERVEIAASRYQTFKAGKALKDAIE